MTTKSKMAPALEGRSRHDCAALTFGALVGAARKAAGTKEKLDFDLSGLEAKIPPAWIAPYAVLRAMLDEGAVPLDSELRRRIHGSRTFGVARAVTDGAPLADSAGDMLATLRGLDDLSVIGDIGGLDGNRRIKVTHRDQLARGDGAPGRAYRRPVEVSGISLAPGTALTLVVSRRDYLRWKAHRATDVEVLEGDKQLVATKV